MNYKTLFFILTVFLISCAQKQITACDCMQILLEEKSEHQVPNSDRKKCESLSKELDFIKEMTNCENYNIFIEEKIEENYQNLINPPSQKDIVIENITN